jgi:hypothetical protein
MSVSTLDVAELAFIPFSWFYQAVVLDRSTGMSIASRKRVRRRCKYRK